MVTSMILIITMIVLSAISVASDAALLSISDNKVEEDAQNGDKRAKRVMKFTENPKPYQTTLQTIMILAAIINGAIALDAFSDDVLQWFDSTLWIIKPLVIIIITVLLLIFSNGVRSSYSKKIGKQISR